MGQVIGFPPISSELSSVKVPAFTDISVYCRRYFIDGLPGQETGLRKGRPLWTYITVLFDVDRSASSQHRQNILHDGEPDKEVVVAKFATTTPHGAIESTDI